MKSSFRSTLSLALALSLGMCQGIQANPEVHEELPSGTHETKPGFASYYAPLKTGPLFHEKHKVDFQDEEMRNHLRPKNREYSQYLEPEAEAMSLMDRFDKTRSQQWGDKEKVIPLEPLLKIYGFKPDAEGWEGKCHQWCASNCDKNVKDILAKVKGMICGPMYYQERDLHELFTFLYPGVGETYMGNRTYVNNAQDLKVNHLDNALYSSLGEDDFLPHIFHKKIHQYLKDGQTVVFDIEPYTQVWNQPVHKIQSEITPLDSELIDKNPKLFPILPPYFYKATTEEAKKDLEKIEDLNRAMNALKMNGTKKMSDKASEIILGSIGHNVSDETINMLQEVEKESDPSISLQMTISKLIQEKAKTYQQAIKNGAQIKKNLEFFKIQSKVDYLLETHYRHGDRDLETNEIHPGLIKQDTYNYHIIKEINDENGNPYANPHIYSYWVGGNAKGLRPDFAWIPKCMTETCDKDAEVYKEKLREKLLTMTVDELAESIKKDENLFAQENTPILNVALSDLMKLLKECFPLNEALDKIESIVMKLAPFKKDKNVYDLSLEEKQKLVDDFQLLKDKKIPLKRSAFDELVKNVRGIKIKDNVLSIMDWNKETGECQEVTPGKVATVGDDKCLVNLKGKDTKIGLDVDNQCKEYRTSRVLKVKKWGRNIPNKVCEKHKIAMEKRKFYDKARIYLHKKFKINRQ